MGISPRTGGVGCVGLIFILIISYFTGVNPLELLQQVGSDQTVRTTPMPSGSAPAGQDRERDFVAAVLGSTEDVWQQLFASTGAQYRPPKLVLFNDAVQSACGMNSAAVGPFYCPPDERVYLDLGFFRELARRFEAPGDFAQAYVIAHEVGHHVQTLLGISEQMRRMQRGLSESDANALSVRQELQADCFAGVWGHHAQQLLEPGDVEEGLRAAQAIGDDMLQRRAQGYVVPESFTHGTSEQRADALRRGLQTGRIDQCQ
jgi:predicted metalloprotease